MLVQGPREDLHSKTLKKEGDIIYCVEKHECYNLAKSVTLYTAYSWDDRNHLKFNLAFQTTI